MDRTKTNDGVDGRTRRRRIIRIASMRDPSTATLGTALLLAARIMRAEGACAADADCQCNSIANYTGGRCVDSPDTFVFDDTACTVGSHAQCICNAGGDCEYNDQRGEECMRFETLDPTALVSTLLGASNQIEVANVAASSHACYKHFSNGGAMGTHLSTNEPLVPEAGVILSTGKPRQFCYQDSVWESDGSGGGYWTGESHKWTLNGTDVGGDADLDQTLNASGIDYTTMDACTIEFDFRCTSSAAASVEFNYVFGSEEYLEYVGAPFNDIFAFYLNGNNIAVVPGTNSTPVDIDTVNQFSNTGYFVENENATHANHYPLIEADGFTTKLTAAGATEGGWNTLKLSLGDTADNNLDSYVLVEAGSLTCVDPTVGPTKSPSQSPSSPPTRSPTASPSRSPSQSPSSPPSSSPTQAPTVSPTSQPTSTPTNSPTSEPTNGPTESPTTSPSAGPTSSPSRSPSRAPSASPSASPTQGPTAEPTIGPSCDNSTITAVDDTATTQSGVPVVIPVLDNDIPVPGWEDLTVISLPFAGRYGTCEIVSGGALVVYEPDDDLFEGEDDCVYQACDDYPNLRCSVAMIRITIQRPDPVANDDYATTDKNVNVAVFPLVNDTGRNLTITGIVNETENGECVVMPSADEVLFIPDPRFVGTGSCIYEACDDRGICDTATIFFNVTGDSEPCDDDNKLETSASPSTSAQHSSSAAPSSSSAPSTSSNPTTSSAPTMSAAPSTSSNPSTSPPPVAVNEFQESGQPTARPSTSAAPSTSTQPTLSTIPTTSSQPSTSAAPSTSSNPTVSAMPTNKIANDDEAETPQDTPILIAVLDNDNDPEDPNAPLEIVNVTNPENGTCEIVDNQIQYTPDVGFYGTDSCIYTVCVVDVEVCDEGKLTVDVIPQPIVNDDVAQTPQDTPVLVDVLDNDQYPEDPDRPLDIISVTDPPNGVCEIVGNQIQYTPDQGFFGADSCIYTVCAEGTEVCDDGTLNVDVIPQPIANDDEAQTPQDTPVLVDVLDNDQPQDPNAPLEIVSVTDPPNGVCQVVGNQIQYAPNQGFFGTDSCVYTVCVEGTEVCDDGTLIVDVTPPVSPQVTPIANDDEAETPQDTPILVDVLDNDQYPEDPDRPLEIVSVMNPPNGVCQIIDNQIQYTPNQGFYGADNCVYTVCVVDTEVCDDGTLTVDVIPQPIAYDDEAETPPNTPVLVDVTLNDQPQDPNVSLDVTGFTSQGENGNCAVVANQVQYTPNEGFVGTDSCVYEVCVEGTTSCDEATLSVSVKEPIKCEPATIGPSTIWLDSDQNGIQDAGELGLPNVAIGLYCTSDGSTGGGNCPPQYVQGTDYGPGDLVTNNGSVYQCKSDMPIPSGWCQMAGYEPGVDSAWADAWTFEGSCKEVPGDDWCNDVPVIGVEAQETPLGDPVVGAEAPLGDPVIGAEAPLGDPVIGAEAPCPPQYSQGADYGPGERVTNNGVIYACKSDMPIPSRWCGMVGYEPGTNDIAWTLAWNVVGSCTLGRRLEWSDEQDMTHDRVPRTLQSVQWVRVATNTTDGNGLYAFYNIRPGQRCYIQVESEGYLYSPIVPGGNQLGPDGRSPVAEVKSGDVIDDWDGGLYLPFADTCDGRCSDVIEDCGWGIWNDCTCQCDCAPGVCLSANQKCYDDCSTHLDANPWGGCRPGKDCPWYPSKLGEAHCESSANFAGIYSIHETAEICCKEHFGGTNIDTCVQNSFADVAAEEQDVRDKLARPRFFWPDLYGKKNCVYDSGYDEWMEGAQSDWYLFDDAEACCDMWYPARNDCPHTGSPTTPLQVDYKPDPSQQFYYPHLTENNCRFGRNYPMWFKLYPKQYLYTSPEECCDDWHSSDEDCPLPEDDGVQEGYYWLVDGAFYPNWKGDWCAQGDSYPEWMAAPEERDTHLYQTAKACCDAWFPDETEACQSNIVTVMGGEQIAGPDVSGTWYPALDARFICLEGTPPSWMAAPGYEDEYVFHSHAECCKAHWCGPQRDLFG